MVFLRPWGVLFACACTALAGAAVIPDEVPELPVLGREAPSGHGHVVELDPVGASPGRTVDGQIGDWVGTPTRFGGTTIFSKGELIYQDHLFDAHGADDGRDAERLATLDPLATAEPRSYRLDPAIMYVPGELDLPAAGPLDADAQYGDAGHRDAADLVELRLGTDCVAELDVLARTTTMNAADETTLLLLLDHTPGEIARDVPFASGLHTMRADLALLFAGTRGWAADLSTGIITELPSGSVATDPGGYTNALEAAIPLALLGSDPCAPLAVAAATGLYGGVDGANHGQIADLGVGARLANVAFREHEPVRLWWEKQQALALRAGSIDDFFHPLDLADLAAGRTQIYVPATGYHDRIFVSAGTVAREKARDGIFQHYGVYLPSTYVAGTQTPLQFWFHFRGGNAHTVAWVSPRTMQEFGEDQHTVVVSPSGRGTSTWYVGRGHVDVNEVWDDVRASFSIDEDRVYSTGHSMGGWASYLMPVLYPDRFAGTMPVAGPVTQGAWTGLDFEGCDDFQYQEYTPCYVDANGSRPRDQHTRKLLDNLLHVPVAVFQGAIDELVPVSGVTRQVEKLATLGYQHRYYLFPTYEHYTHPIVDEWTEGARYLHQFKRDPNPAHVVYVRDMPFERAVEEVQADGFTLSFDFNRAYWMSELTPADFASGQARFDGRSLAIAEKPQLTIPDVGGPSAPGQTGPYVMAGLAWREDPLTAPLALENGFVVTLSGATTVRLDLSRMSIEIAQPISGHVVTDRAGILRLAGDWDLPVTVTVNGESVAATPIGGVLDIPLSTGTNSIAIF